MNIRLKYRHRCAVMVCAALMIWPTVVFAKLHPDLTFESLETKYFVIHYQRADTYLVRLFGPWADQVHEQLSVWINSTPRHKTEVLIVNDSDAPGGTASTFPGNRIVIRMGHPDFVSAKWPDWWSYVFVHEYAHILQLDYASGGWPDLARFFGASNPINPLGPNWYREGFATYVESTFMPGGRVYEAYPRLALAQASGLTYPQLWYRDGAIWPDLNVRHYGLGSMWLQDLQRRDPAFFWELLKVKAGNPLLGLGVDGVDPGRLAQSFLNWRQTLPSASVALADPPPIRLSQSGFEKQDLAVDEHYVYTLENRYASAPLCLVRYHRDTGARQVLYEAHGDSFDLNSQGIVLDDLRYTDSFYRYSDLIYAPTINRMPKRLTQGERALYPALSPDGRQVAYVKNSGERQRLFLLDLPGDVPHDLADEGPTFRYGRLAWSPDGKFLAAERWQEGGQQDIVLVPADGGPLQTLYTDSGKATEWAPCFDPFGDALYFYSDAGGTLQVYRVYLASHQIQQVTQEPGGALYPALSPDGSRLYYLTMTAHGLDIESQHVGDIKAQALTSLKPVPLAPGPFLLDRPLRQLEERLTANVQSYSVWQSLAHSVWFPGAQADAYGLHPGAWLYMSDALDRHALTAFAGYDLTTSRPRHDIRYRYDGWFPTLTLRSQRWGEQYLNLGGDFREDTSFHSLTAQWVFNGFRQADDRAWLTLGGVNKNLAAASNTALLSVQPTLGQYWGLSLGAGWSHMLAYGNSHVYEDGFQFSSDVTFYAPAQGSGGDYQLWLNTAEFRKRPQFFPEHHVLAVTLEQIHQAGSVPMQDSGALGMSGYATGFGARSVLYSILGYSFPLLDVHDGRPNLDLYVRKLGGELRLLRAQPDNQSARGSLQGVLTLAGESQLFGNYYIDLVITQGLDMGGVWQSALQWRVTP